MKKILSFLTVLSVTISVYGEAPAFQWGARMISSDPGLHGSSAAHWIRANDRGDVFVFGVFGSTTAAQQGQNAIGGVHVTYKHYTDAGHLTTTDSPNGFFLESGLNNNDNFCLYKLDRNGNLLWQVTGNRGYINATYSPMIPTRDGGAFLVLKVRPRAAYGDYETGGDRLLRLIDKDGTTTSVTWNSNQVNAYQGVMVKINANGQVEWMKHNIHVEFSPIGSYTTTDAAIYFYDLAMDEEGNYYLGGRFARPITFNRRDGGTVTLTPHNADNWDGLDSSRGDLLLAKLDPDGNLLWNLETTGVVKQQTVECLAYDSKKLHIFGRIQADTLNTGVSSSAFLGRTIVPGNREDSFTARLDVSGQTPQLDWLSHFTTKAQTNGKGGSILPLSLNYDKGVLLATGHFTGFIATGNSAADNILSNDIETGTDNAAQLGFILKQEATTGLLTGQVKDHIGGVGNHIRNATFRENKIHAYGMTLGSLWYASYDADFSNPLRHSLASIDGATATQALFLNDGFIVLGRGRQSPDVAGAPAAFKEDKPAGVSAVILSYALDGLQNGEDNTGMEDIRWKDNSLLVRSLPGAIGVEGNGAVWVFNLHGTVVYRDSIHNASKEIALEKGIYIVTANGKASKILVK
jgi:hypothetical protein